MRILILLLMALSAFAQGPMRTNRSALSKGFLTSKSALVPLSGMLGWFQPEDLTSGTIGHSTSNQQIWVNRAPGGAFAGGVANSFNQCGIGTNILDGFKGVTCGSSQSLPFAASGDQLMDRHRGH